MLELVVYAVVLAPTGLVEEEEYTAGGAVECDVLEVYTIGVVDLETGVETV